MGLEIVVNKNKNCVFNGPYAGRDLYITMLEDTEREFIVTHNVNIKPVSYFTGREIELHDLRQRIEEGRKSVLVSGMGGIGKTHICRKLFDEYISQHEKEDKEIFRHIGYVEYNGDMGSSLQNCLKYKKQENPESDREAAWRELEYLASDGKLLLFVDNVNVSIGDDPELKRLMSIPGAVVLTSRRTSFSSAFEPYRIGFLSTEQCREIYEKIRFEDSGLKIKEEEIQDIEYIIEKLAARHTITIEFLAHLAQTKHWTVQKLRDELEKNGFQLEYMDEEDKLVNIQKSYEALYDMSMLTEAEQNILEAFSLFPYIPLSAEMCNQWLLSDAGVEEDEDILVGLYRKGWLQFEIEQESYALHPVFAKYIYEKYMPNGVKHHRLIQACLRFLEIPKSGFVLGYQKYISFVENIVAKVDMENDVERAVLIGKLAYLLQYMAQYEKAEKLYNDVLEIYRTRLGERHAYTASCYNNLAYTYKQQGKYKRAEELYEKALRIWEGMLGREHPITATGYNNLGSVYERQGKYKKAEELYKKSLRIWERVLGIESQTTATSYHNLAYLYDRQDKYEKAEKLYKKSLGILEKTLGKAHPITSDNYVNLASMYERRGEVENAIIYYFKAYKAFALTQGSEYLNMQIFYELLEKAYVKWKPESNFRQWLEEKMKE